MGAVGLLLRSRKGVLTLLVVLVSTGYALGVLLAAYHGKVSWEFALTLLLGPLVAQASAALVTIRGIATEDAAQKMAANPPATTGGNQTVGVVVQPSTQPATTAANETVP